MQGAGRGIGVIRPVVVGVIANPASGRDVRRLTTGASVFDNGEKGAMVARLLAGLGVTGVTEALVMPAGDGVSESLRRHLRGRPGPLPEVETLSMPLGGDAGDTHRAVAAMVERGVGAIVVLGGDGTHRAVAAGCGDVPLCTLSTGTNNAFPQMREATVAGVATGLVAAGRLDPEQVLRREKRLDVRLGSGSANRTEIALVDVSRTRDRWVGARALWRPESLSAVVVTFADPSAVGLSALAGHLDPVPRASPDGLYVRMAAPEDALFAVTVALAPGLVTRVGVDEVRRLRPSDEVSLDPGPGCLALDGEREVELRGGQTSTVTLGQGPLVIDVDAAMAAAARDHVLTASKQGAAR